MYVHRSTRSDSGRRGEEHDDPLYSVVYAPEVSVANECELGVSKFRMKVALVPHLCRGFVIVRYFLTVEENHKGTRLLGVSGR